MTTPYSGRPIRATDADRDKVHNLLADAYAQGRLNWTEFDARSTALTQARTYDQLSALTVDLPVWVPGSPPAAYMPVRTVQRTNGMAVASLVCGLLALPLSILFLGIVPAVTAIFLGHGGRHRIRRTGEAGGGIALAGLIIGYVYTALFVLVILAVSIYVAGHN
jgi:Domain of unknown function (DUF1707)/Domain of unknown function (DUF4190)